MRKLKLFSVALVLVMMASSVFGCYFIQAQPMSKVKGTYKLTTYTYTREYEKRGDYKPRTYNYVTDEDCLYEDYLVVTGAGLGYYVHKAVNTAPYIKEVTLAYEYNQEDSSKIDYVVYNDAISVNSTSGIHRLGVMKGVLNYSKQAFDYTQLFTHKQMRSEELTVRWEKVSDAIDLSFVESKLGSVKKYDYEAYGVRGIYELENIINTQDNTYQESPYQYYLCVVDTAVGVETAKIYYALKETPNDQIVETHALFNLSGDWTKVQIGDTVWEIDGTWQNYYVLEKDGLRYQVVQRSYSIDDEPLQSIITERMPITETN